MMSWPALLGCSELPPLEAGECGNGIVELSNNEECDSFAEAPAVCRPPDSATGSCRYDCSASPCPSGYSCGADAICRRGSGSFTTAFSGSDQTASVLLADLDGDGRADLVSESSRGVEVLFAGDFGERQSLGLERGRFVVGRFQSPRQQVSRSGGPGTLVILDTDLGNPTRNTGATGGGLNVYRGSASRSLLPTLYPVIPVAADGVRLAQGRMTRQVGQLGVGSDLFAFTDISPYTATRGQRGKGYSLGHYAPQPDGSTTNTPLVTLFELDPFVADKSAGEHMAITPTSGPLVTHMLLTLPIPEAPPIPLPYPCDTIAWSELGLGDRAGAVYLFPLCHLDREALDLSNPPASLRTSVAYHPNYLPEERDFATVRRAKLTPPSGARIVSAPVLRDVARLVDGAWQEPDGLLDVLVASSKGVLVAYGDGRWTINDEAPTSLEESVREIALEPMPGAFDTGRGQAPIAFGDYNHDGLIDWVDAAAIHFNAAANPLLAQLQKPLHRPASVARTLDLDGDGFDDLVVGGESSFSVYRSVKESTIYPQLNRRDYAIEGSIKQFEPGDFDGDGVTDISLVGKGRGADFAAISFGGDGFPLPPAPLGNLAELHQLTTLRFSWLLSGVPDGIDSLVGSGLDANGLPLALALQGKASREMNSRFGLSTLDAPYRRAVALGATPGYFSGDQDGLMLLASSVEVSRDTAPTGDVTFRVWHAPTRGEAELDIATIQASEPLVRVAGLKKDDSVEVDTAGVANATAHLVSGAIGAGDLDGDGYDEAIVVLPKLSLGEQSRPAQLWVGTASREVASSTSVSLQAGAVEAPSALDRSIRAGEQVQIRTGDVDGDGHVDVVVMVPHAEGLAVTIFYGDGSKTLSSARAQTLVAELGILDLALSKVGSGAANLFGLTESSVRRLLVDRAAGTATWDSLEYVHGARNVYNLALGDIDGDGVDDLAISAASGLVIARAGLVLP